MKRIAAAAFGICLIVGPACAAETPPHAIAVAGEVVLELPPDYARVELGVVTQAASASDALAQNSPRMAQVTDAIKSLGVEARDIQTSTFQVQPRYEKVDRSEYYDETPFRKIQGYYVSNKVTVNIRDLKNVAKVIDESVRAGANSTGAVSFNIDALTERFDEARRRAVENARHKAEILATAARIRLGSVISITDNGADTSYDNRAGNFYETVTVSSTRLTTPIEPGLVRVRCQVTVLFATR